MEKNPRRGYEQFNHFAAFAAAHASSSASTASRSSMTRSPFGVRKASRTAILVSGSKLAKRARSTTDAKPAAINGPARGTSDTSNDARKAEREGSNAAAASRV